MKFIIGLMKLKGKDVIWWVWIDFGTFAWNSKNIYCNGGSRMRTTLTKSSIYHFQI